MGSSNMERWVFAVQILAVSETIVRPALRSFDKQQPGSGYVCLPWGYDGACSVCKYRTRGLFVSFSTSVEAHTLRLDMVFKYLLYDAVLVGLNAITDKIVFLAPCLSSPYYIEFIPRTPHEVLDLSNTMADAGWDCQILRRSW